jgi:radical SAM family uncharacterized protein/radical SAM-linked protein
MTCYRDIGTVQKPYQYVGHEENAYRKDFGRARVRFCLAFPDAYEIGMSNVGMQILYHVVNEQDGYLADRVYAPLTDMGAMLRTTGQTLQGRESEEPLRAFDAVGFTLQYELCYTNVLYMLDLGGIPRRARDRGEGDPLVLAGGPCVFNPEPVAAFFDLFVVGEGEEAVLDVLDAIDAAKRQGLSRQETLLALSRVRGVYVPSLYTPRYADDGRFVELERGPDAPRWTERRIVKDLDKAAYPTRPVAPAITPVHERISVEIQRGCTRSCRFCQAGYVYRPRRERDPNTVLSIIEKSVAATGIGDIGLLSLSSADYSHIHPLMREVIARYRDRHLSVSLPSTRLEALQEDYLDVLKEERRSGFTIAPEAGSQRLRNVINKNFTEDEVVETARMLFRNGWQTVKMYFMIGQPTETDADVVAIAELANTVIERCMDIPGRKAVTVSVSNFVPKPHTPFQWHEQITHAEILRKQQLVRDGIRYKRQIAFRSHSADNSYAEGLVARGDRRAADLIERAHDLGAVFDCWQDRLDVEIWRRAAAELLAETGHDHERAGLRGRALDERLPWHRIHSGIHPKFFKNEYLKALYGVATEDCSFAACHECGLCNDQTGVSPVVLKAPVAVAPLAPPAAVDADAGAAPATFRFQHRKTGSAIFLSTLDLQSVLVRAFTRAGLRLQYDQGIRPRPQLSMGPALPLGVSSTCELFDIVIATTRTPAEVIALTNPLLPADLALATGTRLPERAKGLTHEIRAVSYRIAYADLGTTLGLEEPAARERVAAITALPSLIVRKERKSRDGETRLSVVDVKTALDALHARDDGVYFTFAAPNGQSVSPYVLVDALLDAPQVAAARQLVIHKIGLTFA